MNKLPRSGVWAPALTPLPHSPPGKGESGVWAPALTPLPHSPPGKGESGVWAGPPPHTPLVNRQVRVFILQGKTCLIFLSMLPNKSSMLTLLNKNRSL